MDCYELVKFINDNCLWVDVKRTVFLLAIKDMAQHHRCDKENVGQVPRSIVYNISQTDIKLFVFGHWFFTFVGVWS